MRRTIRVIACLCLCATLISIGGCTVTFPVVIDGSTQRPRLIATPAPTLMNDPAILYRSILAEQRIVSLVFEGFTDDKSMLMIADEMKKAKIPCIFFISGVSANEHPDVIKTIHQAGFTIGNYGINAPKSMEEQDVQANAHQFLRGQELLKQATGTTPKLFRCNSSVYSREVLQAANLAGLEAGVEPSVFLNHRSFHDEGGALQFVQKLTRGAIISIKLGQELDYSEYDGTEANMEDIAIDPPPYLSDDMMSTISTTYVNIVPVVTWLIDALRAEGYVVVSPEELQAYRISMFDSPHQLDEKTLSALSLYTYSLPVTDLPMGVQEHIPVNVSSLDGTVLVGDALTAGMQYYVNWRRQSSPEYLDGVQFLTSAKLSIVSSLMRITASSDHPQLNNVRLSVEDALAALNAKTVLIMPGINDVRSYSQEKLIDSLMILIYQIRLKIPNIQICLQTVPPGVKGRFGEPSNMRIFQYNMAIAKFCLEYDIPLIDTAYALRDSEGNLIESLCQDPDTTGIHLNDAGNEQWISLLEHFMPLNFT